MELVVDVPMDPVDIDHIDRHVLFALQQNAREATATRIAESLGVTANTVRNRIERLEERGIIDGYAPEIKYERAGYTYTMAIRCTADIADRDRVVEQALEVEGVVAVRELMTGRRNVEITVVAPDRETVTRAAGRLQELGLTIEEEALLNRDVTAPFDGFDE